MVLYSLIKRQEEEKRQRARQEEELWRERKEEQLRREWAKGLAEGFAQGRAELYAQWAAGFDLLLAAHPELKDVIETLFIPAEMRRTK